MGEDRQYYTYTLKNSLTGLVFYVGKGKYQRLEYHEYQARRGDTSPKSILIREIWDAGGRIIREKVGRKLTEQEAHDLERKLIGEIGLENLMNRTEGGEGVSSRPGFYTPYSFEIAGELIQPLEARIKQSDYKSRRAYFEHLIRQDLGLP